MKKLRLFIIIGVIIMGLMGLVGCKAPQLDTPTGLSIDEATLILSWKPVENAQSYELKVGKETLQSNRNSYVLTVLEAGDYSIKVRAVGDGENFSRSDWSEPIEFTREAESGLLYKLINNKTEYEVAGLGTAVGNVVVDDYFRGKPVTSIGEEAFAGKAKLTGITIGKNITQIGKRAFYNCDLLESIVIPENVKFIDERAFQSCDGLKSVTLPDSITSLSQRMFANCTSLTTVNFGAYTTTIGDYVFSNSGLIEINIPDSVTTIGSYAYSECTSATKVNTGNGLITISEKAFYKCANLTDVTIGNKVTMIGQDAFGYDTSLQSIVIPDNVVKIDQGAFYQCTDLTDITIGTGVESIGYLAFSGSALWTNATDFVYADGWLIGCKNTVLNEVLTLSDRTVGIGQMAFANASGVQILTIPNSVKHIDDYAFPGIQSLVQLKIGSGVERIGKYAFNTCIALTTVTFDKDSNLKTLDNCAFYNCKVLSTVVLPDSVENVGFSTFAKTALSTAQKDSPIYVGKWVVGFNGNLASELVLKEDTIGICSYAFYGAKFKSITIPASVTEIESHAFYSCKSLATVTFSPRDEEKVLTMIPDYAFCMCESLKAITLPDTVEFIGNYAFYQCESLTELILPANLLYLGNYAFYQCLSISKIEFGQQLAFIGGKAFGLCVSLKYVTLPNSLQYLGEYSFYQCSGLMKVAFGQGLKTIGDYAFVNCNALASIEIGGGVERIGNYAFYRCLGLEKVTFGQNVKTIGSYAFFDCAMLKNVVFPDNVVSLEKFAFGKCVGLTSVVIGDNITSMGGHVFYRCNDLTFYCSATGKQDGWDSFWNSTYRPVVWGCEVTEGNELVISVTIKSYENTTSGVNVDYANELKVVTAPYKDGYTFVGWSTNPNATTAEECEFTAENIAEIPVDTTVYAIWKEGVEEPVDPAPPAGPEGPEGTGGSQDSGDTAQ